MKQSKDRRDGGAVPPISTTSISLGNYGRIYATVKPTLIE